jgi:hypothetical protein
VQSLRNRIGRKRSHKEIEMHTKIEVISLIKFWSERVAATKPNTWQRAEANSGLAGAIYLLRGAI